MKFTREQLEKIISEAPEWAEYYTPCYAAEYRKITDRNTYCGFVDGEWMETMDRSLSAGRINKGFNLSKLQKQLDEMKMNDSQDMQSVDSSNKESAYDEGMRNCVKDISRIIGLNFPANVGYGNLADEVDLFIDKIDGRASQDFRSKLIKALGYIDHHLSSDELITRVAEMREECLQLQKTIAITHSVGELSATKGFDSVEDANKYEKIELSGNTEELKTKCSCGRELTVIDGVIHVEAVNPSAIESKWNRGDVAYNPDGGGVIIESTGLVYAYNETEGGGEYWALSDLSKEKPLTPEQKQAQIDEKNGELLFKMEDGIWNGLINSEASVWNDASDESQKVYIELAKKVDFKGKLSA